MWILIGGGAAIFLILVVLIDQRKKIFKKRPKKEKKAPEKEVKKTEEKKRDFKDISFEELKKPSLGNFEYLDLKDDYKIEYTMGSQRPNRNNFRRPFDDEPFRRRSPVCKKVSIKKQIRDLSPEMKAILFSNALGRKVHF